MDIVKLCETEWETKTEEKKSIDKLMHQKICQLTIEKKEF